jgi:PAS domain-containing protein
MHAQGSVVLFGGSTEGLEAPYSAWGQALSHYVEHGPREVIEAHVERCGGELMRLAPGLATRIPGLSAPNQAVPETERYRVHAAAVDLLGAAAKEESLVVVLDDLQWADTQALALLKHLVAGLSDADLLVLGTYRDTGLAPGHRLTQLLGDLRREQGVHRIDLGGLRNNDVKAMMAGAVGQDLPEEGKGLAEEISLETDGNPFFVAEILRHLGESGAVAPDKTGRWVVTGSLAELGLPQSIREVVTGRAARLGEETAELLATAAVIGREFDLGLLSRIVDQGEEEILEMLERAVNVALVNEGPSAGQFSFAHSLVNHALSEELGATRRERTHRRIAKAVGEMYGADSPGAQGAELALPPISTPAFLVDASGTLIFYNEAAEALLGISFKESGRIGAEDWGPTFSPYEEGGEPMPIEERAMTKALRQGKPAHGQFKIRSVSGDEFKIEASAMPIITKEGEGAVIIFWPIDEAGNWT